MSKPDVQPDEGVRSQPFNFEDLVQQLSDDPASTLDVLTFSDPALEKAMNGGGRFISHEELMKRIGDNV